MKKYLALAVLAVVSLGLIAFNSFGLRTQAEKAVNFGATILFGQGGGTGIGTATAGDVGKYLKVSDDSPLTYVFDTPAGGGGSGGGTFSTTTSTHSGRLINYPNNNTDIVTVGGTATTTSATEVYFDPNTENYKIGSSNTASTTIMGLLNFPTLSQGFSYIGSRGRLSSIASSSVQLSWFNNDAGFELGLTAGDGLTRTVDDFDCDTASGSVFGCLTSTDWNIFNGKQDTITAGDALTLTGTDIDFDGGTAPGGSLGGTWASPTIDDLFILNTGDVGTGSYTFPFASTTAFSSEYASSTLQSIGTLTFGGVTGSAWSTFCTSITGGAGLCDGSDDGAGGGLSAYDAWTHATVGLSATTSALAVSTSTNPSLYPITAFSSTLPQLSLSAGGGLAQWTMRNAGGDFFLSTTTVAGTATTSISALSIAGSGFGTTTVRGLNISGSATSTSNVGFNITTGCFAINGTCLSTGGSSASSTLLSDFNTFSNTNQFTGNIGLSTTTPFARLSINSTGGETAFVIGSSTATSFIVDKNGNVGVGTASPTSKLHLIGAGSATNMSSLVNFSSGSGASNANIYAVTVDKSGIESLAFGINKGTGTGSVPANSAFISTYLTTGSLSIGRGNGGGLPSSSDIFINSTGNVGIGTTTPTYILNPFSATAPQLALSAGAGLAQWTMRNAGGNLYFATTTVAGTATTSTAAMTLSAAGKPGLSIGSTTPFATLSVNPVAGDYNNRFVVGSSSATSLRIDNSGHLFLPQLTSDAAAHTYTMCGEATTFEAIWDTTTCVLSAAKYKTNIGDLDIGLEELLKVRPVTFNWKPTGDPMYDEDINVKHEQIGVIADEIEKIDSRLVVYNKDGEINGFRYDFYTAWLTKAIQELATKGVQTKRSAEENWQWIVIGLLILGFGYQQVQINHLKKHA